MEWLLFWFVCCIASPMASAAAVAAAGHHEERSQGQATNSACHSVASLVGALAFTSQIEDTLMLAV